MKKIENRYENKFIVNNNLNFINIIKHIHHLEFKRSYKERYINSTYYDTFNFELARQNIDGLENRYKVRIRYYGKEEINNSHLELKNKNGNNGNKQLFNINQEKFTSGELNLNNLLSKNQKTLDMIDKFYLLNPILHISYKRNYYISTNKKYRITFDNDITFIKMSNFSNINLIKTFTGVKFKKNIMEFKYDLDNYFVAREITSKLPCRLTSCSKYLIGLNLLNLVTL